MCGQLLGVILRRGSSCADAGAAPAPSLLAELLHPPNSAGGSSEGVVGVQGGGGAEHGWWMPAAVPDAGYYPFNPP